MDRPHKQERVVHEQYEREAAELTDWYLWDDVNYPVFGVGVSRSDHEKQMKALGRLKRSRQSVAKHSSSGSGRQGGVGFVPKSRTSSAVWWRKRSSRRG